jgi:hypothetical protein
MLLSCPHIVQPSSTSINTTIQKYEPKQISDAWLMLLLDYCFLPTQDGKWTSPSRSKKNHFYMIYHINLTTEYPPYFYSNILNIIWWCWIQLLISLLPWIFSLHILSKVSFGATSTMVFLLVLCVECTWVARPAGGAPCVLGRIVMVSARVFAN